MEEEEDQVSIMQAVIIIVSMRSMIAFIDQVCFVVID